MQSCRNNILETANVSSLKPELEYKEKKQVNIFLCQ